MNVIYLLLISSYVLFIGYKFIKPSVNKSQFITLLILLGFSASLFLIMNVVTFNPRPNGAVSGNGNLGIIVLFLLIPIFLVQIIFWSKGLYVGFQTKLITEINRYIIHALLLFILGIVSHSIFIINRLTILAGHSYNPFEPGYRGNMINQYTNTLFFNGNTFGIVISVVMIITLILLRLKKIEKSSKMHLI